MNAGEALSLFLRRIGDPNGDRVGPAEALTLIDQGVTAFNREARILRTDSAVLSVDATYLPSSYPVGIATPTAAPTDNGAGALGNVRYSFTYYDAGLELESNPSPDTATLAFGGTVTWVASSDSRVDSVNIYATSLADPTGLQYFLKTVAIGTTSQNTAALTVDTAIARPFNVGANAYYTKPTTMMELVSIEYLGRRLQFATEDQLRGLYANWREELGDPWYYTVNETHIRIVPYLTVAIPELFTSFIRNPIATATNNRVDLPAQYELAAISWAAAEWLMQNNDRQDTDTVKYLLSDYAMMLDQAASFAAVRGVRTARRIGRRWV